MQTIKHIGIGSAFKFGFLLGGLMFAVFGVFIVVLPSLFGGGILSALMQEQGMDMGRELFGLGAGLVSGLILYVVGIIVYAIFSAITLAIQAFIYNIVAALGGGIKVELS